MANCKISTKYKNCTFTKTEQKTQHKKTPRNRVVNIVVLITFLSIYVLGNLHLSQTVGGIRLSKGKEIHPIP
jgi:hypothetical protein